MSQLSRRVARSRAARWAALPVRTGAVARHDWSVVRESARWLVRSREHTNFTYDLTARNREHLAWWVGQVTASPVGDIRAYFDELEADRELNEHVRRETRSSDRWRLADDQVRFGRRLGWYAIVRATEPQHVVETGTDKGLGSCIFAAALLKNGTGRLTTIDVNPDSGYLIKPPYAGVIERVVGDSVQVLQGGSDPIDLFLHDSWHTPEHELAELEAVAPRLGARMALSDNAHASDALMSWAERSGKEFSFFRERPLDHWYPGAGIGAAWKG